MALFTQFSCGLYFFVFHGDRVQPGDFASGPVLIYHMALVAGDCFPVFFKNQVVSRGDPNLFIGWEFAGKTGWRRADDRLRVPVLRGVAAGTPCVGTMSQIIG